MCTHNVHMCMCTHTHIYTIQNQKDWNPYLHINGFNCYTMESRIVSLAGVIKTFKC